MPHALRKTTGPFSAGTRVRIISDNEQDKTYTVEVLLEPNENYDYEDLTFDIDFKDVVELRSREETAPSVSRENKRELVAKLMGSK